MLLGLRKTLANEYYYFFVKLCFEIWENINVFWKGNKTKDGNKYDYNQAEIDITAKNYITTSVFPLIPFFFSVFNRLFKNMFINYENIINYLWQFINYEIPPK